MQITRIETQKKNPSRKNIYVDGNFLVGVSDETLLRAGFRSGDAMSPEQIKSLQHLEELQSAKQAAYRYLSVRPRTEKEIRTKLREKEFAEDDISATVAELKESGLINDVQFARMYVSTALQRRPSGAMLLRQKMLLLGLDKSLIESTLHDNFTADTQQGLALQAAHKFLKKSHKRETRDEIQKLRAKLGQFLARRGFSWDIIQPTLKATMKIKTKGTDE